MVVLSSHYYGPSTFQNVITSVKFSTGNHTPTVVIDEVQVNACMWKKSSYQCSAVQCSAVLPVGYIYRKRIISKSKNSCLGGWSSGWMDRVPPGLPDTNLGVPDGCSQAKVPDGFGNYVREQPLQSGRCGVPNSLGWGRGFWNNITILCHLESRKK